MSRIQLPIWLQTAQTYIAKFEGLKLHLAGFVVHLGMAFLF